MESCHVEKTICSTHMKNHFKIQCILIQYASEIQLHKKTVIALKFVKNPLLASYKYNFISNIMFIDLFSNTSSSLQTYHINLNTKLN